MRFHADNYFAIGAAHASAGLPCQDYAVCTTSGENAYAVVSDGCSTGDRTDIGARVVALAAIQAVLHGSGIFGEQQPYLIRKAIDTLGLCQSDLLATCLFCSAGTNGGYFYIIGDGVVAMKLTDGQIIMHRLDWNHNTPFYPAYRIDSRSEDAFFSKHGGPHAEALNIETVLDDGSHSYTKTAMEGSIGILFQFNTRDVEFAALFSDGVTQIDGVDWKDAVREFLNFKTLTGEFVKRRAMRALKDMRDRGRGPVDDFSMAVIRVER